MATRLSHPDEVRVGGVFRALGDPTRLRLVALIREHGQCTQGELVRATGATQSRVSEHLRWLRWSGLVDAERRGRSVIYRLAGATAEGLIDLAAAHVAADPLAGAGERGPTGR